MRNIGDIGGWFGTVISIIAGIGLVAILVTLILTLLFRLWGVC